MSRSRARPLTTGYVGGKASTTSIQLNDECHVIDRENSAM
jgi:hypothetical protein